MYSHLELHSPGARNQYLNLITFVEEGGGSYPSKDKIKQVIGLTDVSYSYVVPDMIWKKFHENRMLESAKTNFPLLALTT